MPFIKAKNLTNHTKIIPCPFCGESEEIAVEGYTTEAGLRWRIVCCNYMAGIDKGWDQSPVITTRKKISVTTKRTNTPVGDWFDEHHSKGVAYLLGFAD